MSGRWQYCTVTNSLVTEYIPSTKVHSPAALNTPFPEIEPSSLLQNLLDPRLVSRCDGVTKEKDKGVTEIVGPVHDKRPLNTWNEAQATKKQVFGKMPAWPGALATRAQQ